MRGEIETAEVFVEPTQEMLFWTGRLRWIVEAPERRTSRLGRAIAVALVAPLAHCANLSLQFQSYLYDIFHQSWTARVGHAVCMPLICVMTVAALLPSPAPALGSLNAASAVCLVLG